MSSTEYDNLARARNWAKKDNLKKYKEGYAKIVWKKDRKKDNKKDESTGEEICHDTEKCTTN